MFSGIGASELLILFAVILVAMSFHEAMHAFAGHWLGDTTARDEGRLTLNPLKHIDIVTTVLLPVVLIAFGLPPIFAAKPVPFNPDRVKFDEFGAALIALVGPLTNLVLAVLGAGILKVVDLDQLSTLYEVILLFVQVNIAFFVFNMIPFPPLDGSRLLYAFAPAPLQAIMRQIEGLGFMSILLFFFLFLPVIAPVINSVNLAIYRLLL